MARGTCERQRSPRKPTSSRFSWQRPTRTGMSRIWSRLSPRLGATRRASRRDLDCGGWYVCAQAQPGHSVALHVTLGHGSEGQGA
jgi:hypothetical protein